MKDSPVQVNLIRWYVKERGQRVLLVGECHASVGEFFEGLGDEVEAVGVREDSVGRREEGQDTGEARLTAQRLFGELRERDGNAYDLIVQIGAVLGQQEVLEEYRRLLQRDGSLLVAVPNRLGLKYFAGCKDEGGESYFKGLQGENESCPHMLSEYRQMLDKAGFGEAAAYYPYPDYHTPLLFFSDRRLPQEGELFPRMQDFGRERYSFFDEAKVGGSIVREGLYPGLANSFLFVYDPSREVRETIYVKFSAERDARYRICTRICEGEDGRKRVLKIPLTKEAQRHIAALEEFYKKSESVLAGKDIRFCPVRLSGGAALFEWAEGEPLQRILAERLQRGETDAAEELLLQYRERMRELYGLLPVPFDVDVILPNIFVDGGRWTIIDYEWIVWEPVSLNWVLYRCMLHLSMELAGYELTELSRLLSVMGLDEEKWDEWRDEECRFQKMLKGDAVPIQNLSELAGSSVLSFAGTETPEEQKCRSVLEEKEKLACRIYSSMDSCGERDGRVFCFGWACAELFSIWPGGKKTCIPVRLEIYDGDGKKASAAAERLMRPDVAEVLKAKGKFPYWGFQCNFAAEKGKAYTLCMSAGRCKKEISLTF